jgi:adenylate cyclase
VTVLFCDMKGFTSLSEGMTPQGLVKVMNHYLSTMSGPIRNHHGIIDKYIGELQANPPAADWDGAWVLDQK